MKLFSLFSKTEKPEILEEGIELSIFIDDKKQMDIGYAFSKMDKNEVEIFAKFLYGLNKGLLLGLFLETLIMEKSDPSKINFIESVLDRLNDYYELELDKGPIIKPSNTFTKNVK
jgi:hypothetical protein